MTESASLHRMVMPDHLCPWGLKARHLLQGRGCTGQDDEPTTSEQTNACKAHHGVTTTPQVLFAGGRVGGYDDRRCFLGMAASDPEATTHMPVVVVFLTTAAMAGVLIWLSAPITLIVVGIGAVLVFKAVFIENHKFDMHLSRREKPSAPELSVTYRKPHDDGPLLPDGGQGAGTRFRLMSHPHRRARQRSHFSARLHIAPHDRPVGGPGRRHHPLAERATC